MNKRMAGLVSGSVLAGAALVGVPAVALANQPGDGTPPGAGAPSDDMRQMGAVMSDPEFRDQMKSFMSEMMSDPQLREQMTSMMSEVMEGQMDGMDMGGDMGAAGGAGGTRQDDARP